ncbi:MAG TPA: serine/threonine-protein kinase, partial [Polyangiales bacterium]|nr:serine/threonine-protein kinase [Polyangiales bacterium]
MQDPLLGRTVAGRYVIEDKIGGGGMGVVYRGRHQVIDREVAIKFLHPRFTRDPTSRKRFLGEARAANQINHENIIDITDFGETEDGQVYLVMEYLQGRSLDQEIAKRPMAVHRALRIGVQIASGLARAHELDVIHRDVKPGNVFLMRRRGDPDFVKLLDFGIARFEREVRITDRGVLMGTPEYMAPEQVRNGEATPLTDLYALGCVLYEMLTGETPFSGGMSEVLIKQMREPPPLPSRSVPGLPAKIDQLVLKLLSKDPERRHRDAFHVVDDLQQLLDDIPAIKAAVDPFPRQTPDGAARPASEPITPVVSVASVQGSLPTMHAPTEHEEWRERVAMYRQLLDQMHPRGDIPLDVRSAIERMEGTLAQLPQLRTQLHSSARSLTTQEDEVRATRLRIGRALDELVSEESKLARQLDAGKRERGLAEGALRDTVRALATRAPSPLPRKRPGETLSSEDVQQLDALHTQLSA